MLRLAFLVALLAAPAYARDWAKAACDDDFASCKENCTIEDGTDLNLRGRLDRCLVDCKQQNDKCEFKKLDAQRKAKAPKATVISDAPSVRVDGQAMSSTVLPAKGSLPAAKAKHEEVPSALDPMPHADFTPTHKAPPSAPQPPARPAQEDPFVDPPAPSRPAHADPLIDSPAAQPAPSPAVVPAPNYDRLGGSHLSPAPEPAHKVEAEATSTEPEQHAAPPADKSLPVAKTNLAEDDHIDDLLDKPAPSPSSPPSEGKAKSDEPPKKTKDISDWNPDE